MFDYIPDALRARDRGQRKRKRTAGSPATRSARRPPELLTRDVVARAITAEIKAGRGSPHGGACSSTSRRSVPAETIKRKKLPSMYHQFKELAEVDITAEPMEVGPTLHYFMGGIRVARRTRSMTKVPGLFACGECAAGHARCEPTRRQLAVGPSDRVRSSLSGVGAVQSIAAVSRRRRRHRTSQIRRTSCSAAVRPRHGHPQPRERPRIPYRACTNNSASTSWSDHVGIVRQRGRGARGGIAKLETHASAEAAKDVKAHGASQYNPGWHEALVVRNSLLVTAEGVDARRR